MDIDLSIALILGMVALLAGFFDAIVGGGGLLTLPALFVAGLDPLSAMATNKLQASCASVSATAAFARRGMIDWRADAGPAIASCMAGAAGALSISMIPRGVLQAAIPLLLLAVAAYFALSPKVDERPRKSRISRYAFMLAVVPIIGFYDGVFGPGTGSFFMIAFMLLLAQPLLTAVCRSKLLNAACNVGALSVFMLNGALAIGTDHVGGGDNGRAIGRAVRLALRHTLDQACRHHRMLPDGVEAALERRTPRASLDRGIARVGRHSTSNSPLFEGLLLSRSRTSSSIRGSSGRYSFTWR